MSSFLTEYNTNELTQIFAQLLSHGVDIEKVPAAPVLPGRLSITPNSMKPNPLETMEELLPEECDDSWRSTETISDNIEKPLVLSPEKGLAAGFSSSKISCDFSNGDPTRVKVRGSSFVKDKKKSFSGESFYNLVTIDMLKNTSGSNLPISDIGANITMPKASIKRVANKADVLPRMIIVNLQIPTSSPNFFGKSDPDAGINLIQYFEIKQSTYDESIREGQKSKQIRLLRRFCEKLSSDPDTARRFKLIGVCSNLTEVGVPQMFHSYNGKPVIVFKAGVLRRGYINGDKNDTYIQIDVNVHEFAYIARKGLHALRSDVSKMQLTCAYVIQAESDDELPEQIFACADMSNVNLHNAVPVSFH